jgi:hypothetical protein
VATVLEALLTLLFVRLAYRSLRKLGFAIRARAGTSAVSN